MGQVTIFDYMNGNIPKSKKKYVFLKGIPEVYDTDMKRVGPFDEGDMVEEGEITKELIEILLLRKIIKEVK